VAVPISQTRFTCVRFEALTAMLKGGFRSSEVWHYSNEWVVTDTCGAFIIFPWKQRNYISSKCGELFSLWHRLTSHNTWILRVY